MQEHPIDARKGRKVGLVAGWGRYPFVVAAKDGVLGGIAYASPWKLRGAYNKIASLPRNASRVVVAASAGNHAQGVALAATRDGWRLGDLWIVVGCALGAWLMRGAGCTWNDITDRQYDAQVARTRSRPIPSGQVTVRGALAWMVAQALIAFGILLTFNPFTIFLGIAALIPVAIYPFMKRFTYWPQLVLGLTFNWGALVGWAAVHGALGLAPALLYGGCVLWTIAYDTIYAHQDKEDDLSLGLKSTAIRFGSETKPWLTGLFAGAVLAWAAAAILGSAVFFTFLALAAIASHFYWQVTTLRIDDADNCLLRFKSNRWIGWALLAGLCADVAVRGLLGAA